jgi:hypothetical protein
MRSLPRRPHDRNVSPVTALASIALTRILNEPVAVAERPGEEDQQDGVPLAP